MGTAASICASGHCAYVACCPTSQPPLGTWNFSALTALRINTLWRKAEQLEAQYPLPSDPKMEAERKKMRKTKYLMQHMLPADAPMPKPLSGSGASAEDLDQEPDAALPLPMGGKAQLLGLFRPGASRAGLTGWASLGSLTP